MPNATQVRTQDPPPAALQATATRWSPCPTQAAGPRKVGVTEPPSLTLTHPASPRLIPSPSLRLPTRSFLGHLRCFCSPLLLFPAYRLPQKWREKLSQSYILLRETLALVPNHFSYCECHIQKVFVLFLLLSSGTVRKKSCPCIHWVEAVGD